MPTSKDVRINIGLPEEKAFILEKIAQGPPYDGSKSKVLEEAFDRLLEARADTTVIATFQQQLSAMQDTLLATIRAASTAPAPSPTQDATVEKRLMHISQQLSALVERQLTLIRQEFNHAYDTLNARLPPLTPQQSTPPAVGWLMRVYRWCGW